jgi:Fuc2NAc and GlcNAc transferase
VAPGIAEAIGMTVDAVIYTLITAFFASVGLTALVRMYLVKRGILDIPNGRSSHSVPVPRGGGISIVAVFLLGVVLLLQRQAVSNSLAWALVGGGVALGTVGFLDDHFQISAWLRLAIHFAAAGWAIWRLGGIAPLPLGSGSLDWGWIGQLLALVGLVWFINLYNFMDGIDGLAGMEAVCASGLGGLLLLRSGLGGYAEDAWLLAAASGGFLVWNWPPAKIFMGDVGSGFLGFVLGVFALSSAKVQPVLFWPWLIQLSAFIVDPTVTLIRRLITGERWYEAHRSHAYQHAARRWGSHSKVTLAITALNVAWLFPLAWGAYAYPMAGPIFTVIAVSPLVYLAFRFDAGRSELSPAGKCPESEVGVDLDSQS